MNTFYNVGSADISQGLQDFEISSGQDYFILLSAPSNANVQIRLNENTAPQIPIKEHWQFKSADVKKIYISCEPIAGEIIKWGQADGNLEITTNPTINQIDTISTMGVTFAEQMDKIINPYDTLNPSILSAISNASGSLTTMIDTSLDCDKIIINLKGGIIPENDNSASNGLMMLYIDNVLVDTDGGRNDIDLAVCNPSKVLFLEGVRNKNIKIKYLGKSSSYWGFFYIQKFNLKA